MLISRNKRNNFWIQFCFICASFVKTELDLKKMGFIGNVDLCFEMLPVARSYRSYNEAGWTMIVNDAKEQRIINSRWFVPLDNPHRPWHPFPRTNFRENYGQRSGFTVGELYSLGRKVALSKNRVELISSFETKVYRTSPRTKETKRRSRASLNIMIR